MKNTVSFETAKRLKAAGFPQPETVQEGQFWYSCIVRKTRERELRYINQFDRTGILPTEFFACYPYFAPTATDILAALFPAEIQFQISAMQVLQMALDPESAAAAWLEIHEKKAFTPNARIRFNREQTIECYDENGKQNLLVIGKGKEYDAILKDMKATIKTFLNWSGTRFEIQSAILKDMKATIKTVFGPVEFHLSNDDIVFLEWL